MEKFYQIAKKLAVYSEELADELFKYNPSFGENNGKKSLAVLAGIARELKYGYEQMNKDLTQKHERNQKNAIFQKNRI